MHKNEALKLDIGKITGAIGLKGEIKIFHTADDPDFLATCGSLWIDEIEYDVINLRYKKKIPIFKLKGIENRNKAEELIGKSIYTYGDDPADLPPGSYYVKDLKDLDVISADGMNKIGRITDVISGASQDVYEIETDDGRKMLFPAVTDFIIEVNPEEGFISVNLPDGIEDIKY